ncbi:MAG: B12-binding domain-containing protein [Acidobacteriota bacterium]|nr:B12-binding domain-containing protein [Acidobacteriota bacterium]
MPGAKNLKTKEVARICGVSDATVKRWAEAGILRSEKTSGGHRRFRAEDVARFQLESGLGLKQTGAVQPILKTVSARLARKFQDESALFRALVAGHEDETTALLIDAFLRGKSLAQIFDREICPAMTRVGELWFENQLSVADEHLATRTVLSSVQKLQTITPVAESNGKLAMCCTIEGDFHELSAHLVQVLLENAGWEVLNFGAHTPLFALAEKAVEHKPDLICISAAIMPDVERAARDLRNFRADIAKINAAIVIGGRGFTDERVRCRFEAVRIVETFTELSEIAANLS